MTVEDLAGYVLFFVVMAFAIIGFWTSLSWVVEHVRISIA